MQGKELNLSDLKDKVGKDVIIHIRGKDPMKCNVRLSMGPLYMFIRKEKWVASLWMDKPMPEEIKIYEYKSIL